MNAAIKHSLSLLSEHDELHELFEKHQRALLTRDLDVALTMITALKMRWTGTWNTKAKSCYRSSPLKKQKLREPLCRSFVQNTES